MSSLRVSETPWLVLQGFTTATLRPEGFRYDFTAAGRRQQLAAQPVGEVLLLLGCRLFGLL